MMEEERIRKHILKLSTLTRHNDLQNRRVSSLDSVIRVRWQFMASSMRADEIDYDFYSARIEECNQSLSKSISVLNEEEERLLEQRSDQSMRYQATAPLPLFALQIVIAFCLLVGFFRVTADLKIKERLQVETDQKNKELKEQRDFIHGIFENTVDIVIIFDVNLNIVALNKRARQIYDPEGNAVGRNVLDLYPQSNGSDSIKGVRDALEGKHTHNQARESIIKPGNFYESFFVPLFSGEKIIGAMAIHHDVSDLIRMTSDIQAINTQLQKSNHELEQFAYVTSHDLQEPLRKIRTFSDLAKRNIDNREVVSRNLDKLASSAERMSFLIRDILNYSKLSNTDPNKEVVDLDEVLDQVLQDFELTIEEKDAVVESNRLPKVLGSRQQLTQVFSNLVSNALKFCKSTPCIKIGCRHNNGIYTITFSDNGIGFDQAYAEQIFGVFQRLHHSTEFGGTGIGLALCKRIIENHGGTIKATSAPNKGTTFSLTLPDLLKPNWLAFGQVIQKQDKTSAGNVDAG
jgi:signal transduction histidine kinase